MNNTCIDCGSGRTDACCEYCEFCEYFEYSHEESEYGERNEIYNTAVSEDEETRFYEYTEYGIHTCRDCGGYTDSDIRETCIECVVNNMGDEIDMIYIEQLLLNNYYIAVFESEVLGDVVRYINTNTPDIFIVYCIDVKYNDNWGHFTVSNETQLTHSLLNSLFEQVKNSLLDPYHIHDE